MTYTADGCERSAVSHEEQSRSLGGAGGGGGGGADTHPFKHNVNTDENSFFL